MRIRRDALKRRQRAVSIDKSQLGVGPADIDAQRDTFASHALPLRRYRRISLLARLVRIASARHGLVIDEQLQNRQVQDRSRLER